MEISFICRVGKGVPSTGGRGNNGVVSLANGVKVLHSWLIMGAKNV